jgi:hypothetical protein
MSTWLSGYKNRLQLTIDHTKITSALTNFPIMVKLSASCGITAKDMSNIFDSIPSSTGYQNIIIMGSDNVTQIYAEVQSWNPTTKIAVLWVTIPSISSTVDTVFYIYYNNSISNTAYIGLTGASATIAAQVWDTNYQAVHHLEQDPSGTAPQIIDSSTNAWNGATYGSMTSGQLVSAIIGNGLSLDGSNDYIDIGNVAHSSAISLECIIKPTSSGLWQYIISRSNTAHQFFLALQSDNTLKLYCNDGTNAFTLSSASTFNTNTWYHIAAILPGAGYSAYIYINGVQDATANQSYSIQSINNHITYGWNQALTAGRQFHGIIDEFRISKTSRSASYVKASYYSSSDNLITYSLQFQGTRAFSNDIYDCWGTRYFSNLIANTLVNRCSKNIITEGFNRYSKCAMTEDYTQYFINEIIDGKKIRTVFSNDISLGFNKTQYFGSSLDAYCTIRQYSLNQLAEPEAIILTPAASPSPSNPAPSNPAPSSFFDVRIDGISVTHLINSVNIRIAESSFTNQVTITFLNLDMYNQCDPAINYGMERIIVTISGNVYKFVIENRNRSEQFGSYRFTLTGRQLPIFLGAGFALPADNILENKMASSIAATLGGNLVNITWSAMDYFIPDFTYIGFPIDGIKILADGVGAIMRATSDGQLIIRKKFGVRPENLSSIVPPFIFRDSQILKREIAEQKATYNAVEVISTGNSADALELTPMDTCITIDAVSKVKVYTGRNKDYKINISSGTLTKMSTGSLETLQEQIIITAGRGLTSKRIFGVNSYEFIQCPNANAPKGSTLGLLTNPYDGLKYPFNWIKGSKDILLAGTGTEPERYTGQNTPIQEGILIINYNTIYDLWTVSNNVAGSIMMAAETANQGINMIVVTGDGARMASPIQHPYISAHGQAVEIATASLDETSTKKYIYKITVPYCNAYDGQLAMVDNKKGYIRQANITLDVKDKAAVIMQELMIEIYEEI